MLLFFCQTILSFVLSRKIINIYNDIVQKYGNVTVKVVLVLLDMLASKSLVESRTLAVAKLEVVKSV